MLELKKPRLHWFLVNIYRLEPMEVDNIICDGQGDNGIDGIYINDNEECIDIFQSKIVQKDTKTLGDTHFCQVKTTELYTSSLIVRQSLVFPSSTCRLAFLKADSKPAMLNNSSVASISFSLVNSSHNSIGTITAIRSPFSLDIYFKSGIFTSAMV